MGVQASLRVDGATEIFPGYVVIPTGGKVIYVHSSGPSALDQLPPGMPGNPDGFFTSINAALATVRSNRSDNVIALPGHTDTISAADGWSNLGSSAGVNIYGLGEGNNQATISFTAAASSILFDTANLRLDGFRINMEPTTGTVNVAAPITVSAAGCRIRNNRIFFGTDANNKVTIGVTTTAAADDFTFEDNQAYGAALATCTTFLRIVGGARARILRNTIVGGTTSAAVGVIQNLTTVATNADISCNKLHNNAASSTACITWALANATGWITDNKCRNMTDASNAQIVVTSGDMQLDNNKGVNNSNETAILLGTPSA